MALYDFYTEKISACDTQIEQNYFAIRPDWQCKEVVEQPVQPKRLAKNAPKGAGQLRSHLKRICGVDLVAVHGISVPLAQTILTEIGTDMSKFPNEKHFCSWLGLAPKNEISGGKILVSRTLKTRNRADQAFRLAAVSVRRADCVFGAFYRRLKSRLSPAQATAARAHFIARIVYRMLKYQIEYEPLSLSEYEKRYHDQQIKYLEKKGCQVRLSANPGFNLTIQLFLSTLC